MAREVMVPLSAVLALIERQEAFNTQLIDKLGLFLVQAAEKYERALNPPLPDETMQQMQYTQLSEEGEDLLDMVEKGTIDYNSLNPAMKRMIGDTQVTYDP